MGKESQGAQETGRYPTAFRNERPIQDQQDYSEPGCEPLGGSAGSEGRPHPAQGCARGCWVKFASLQVAAEPRASGECSGRPSTWCFGWKGLGWSGRLSPYGAVPSHPGQVRNSQIRPIWHNALGGLCRPIGPGSLPSGSTQGRHREPIEPCPSLPITQAHCLVRPDPCLGAGVGAGSLSTGLLLIYCPHVPCGFSGPLSLSPRLLPGHTFAWNVPEQPATSSRKSFWTSQRKTVISPPLAQQAAH